jgi:hypothetical protein
MFEAVYFFVKIKELQGWDESFAAYLPKLRCENCSCSLVESLNMRGFAWSGDAKMKKFNWRPSLSGRTCGRIGRKRLVEHLIATTPCQVFSW